MKKLTPRQKRLIKEKETIFKSHVSKIDKWLEKYSKDEVVKSFLEVEKDQMLRKIGENKK
jgi:hypothetical protein